MTYFPLKLKDSSRPSEAKEYERIELEKHFWLEYFIQTITGTTSIFFIFLFSLTVNLLSAQYTESDWDERDKWMDVTKMFNLANLRPGHVVADIGCHEGYLSIHLAKRVGVDGRVFAVDVLEHRLNKLNENAEKRNLENITTVLADYDNPKLPNRTFDAIFILDTYHDMRNYMTILSHVKKALKPGGFIVISEELKDSAKGKSRFAQTRLHTLSPKYVRKELKEAGFTIVGDAEQLGYWHNTKSRPIWALVSKFP